MKKDICYISQPFLKTLQNTKSHEAWDEFYRLYDDFISRIIYKMIKGEEDIKDISQEVKLHIWRRIQNYTPGSAKFTSWLQSVVRNKVLDILKKQKKQNVEYRDQLTYDFELLDDSRETEIREWRNQVLKKSLHKVSVTASPLQMQFIDLFLAGSTIPDICQKMKISSNYAYQIKKRMKQRLQKEAAKLVHS
ncbi:MAG: sigma-70 family RNA polymerase sigma factor [Lentisphaerales bacterium]|nr:sigma-70 family RNA polymerase sigma factor [Lentisphaerales bacterium]